jgi:hypothetical protein
VPLLDKERGSVVYERVAWKMIYFLRERSNSNEMNVMGMVC